VITFVYSEDIRGRSEFLLYRERLGAVNFRGGFAMNDAAESFKLGEGASRVSGVGPIKLVAPEIPRPAELRRVFGMTPAWNGGVLPKKSAVLVEEDGFKELTVATKVACAYDRRMNRLKVLVNLPTPIVVMRPRRSCARESGARRLR